MAKPAIVAVDDDAQVAAAVVSDLRRRYADEGTFIVEGVGHAPVFRRRDGTPLAPIPSR